jgi:hypothetical protein
MKADDDHPIIVVYSTASATRHMRKTHTCLDKPQQQQYATIPQGPETKWRIHLSVTRRCLCMTNDHIN